MKNQDRFNILRGYSDNSGFHSKGTSSVNLIELLKILDFKSLDAFIIWYKSLTLADIKDGKKEWCSGNCCQSILKKLLKIGKINK
jgi:hypothetical protein